MLSLEVTKLQKNKAEIIYVTERSSSNDDGDAEDDA